MTPLRSDAPFVVVGVDGSDGSRHALRFAALEAHARGARLRIVTAWRLPIMGYAAGFTLGISATTCQKDAEYLSADAVREAHHVAPETIVEALVVEDDSTSALLAAAVGSEMLVVGPEAHGRVVRLLLGLNSVDDGVARHATCPVTIVDP